MRLKENLSPPTNSIGASSSTPGTGAIDIFNPILSRRNRIVKRVVAMWNKKEKDENAPTKQQQQR